MLRTRSGTRAKDETGPKLIKSQATAAGLTSGPQLSFVFVQNAVQQHWRVANYRSGECVYQASGGRDRATPTANTHPSTCGHISVRQCVTKDGGALGRSCVPLLRQIVSASPHSKRPRNQHLWRISLISISKRILIHSELVLEAHRRLVHYDYHEAIRIGALSSVATYTSRRPKLKFLSRI